MSTKCTIACGENPATEFHLYFDFADDKVHLELDNVSLVIPRDVMEAIVKEVKEPDFKLPTE